MVLPTAASRPTHWVTMSLSGQNVFTGAALRSIIIWRPQRDSAGPVRRCTQPDQRHPAHQHDQHDAQLLCRLHQAREDGDSGQCQLHGARRCACYHQAPARAQRQHPGPCCWRVQRQPERRHVQGGSCVGRQLQEPPPSGNISTSWATPASRPAAALWAARRVFTLPPPMAS